MFWTQSLPNSALKVTRRGRRAKLKLKSLPIPDTFQFANNVSVSAEIDVNVTWRATGGFVSRGLGTSVPDNDPNAMEGEFAEATCRGRGGGRETGFHFRTGQLSEEGFYADVGYERNGVFRS